MQKILILLSILMISFTNNVDNDIDINKFNVADDLITTREQLGDFNHYNGIVFDYFHSIQSDIEGALAVGGESSIGTSGQFDIGAVSVLGHLIKMGTFTNPDNLPALLLNGLANIGVNSNNGESSINVHGGDVVVNENLRDLHTKQERQIRGNTKFASGDVVDQFFNDAYQDTINLVEVLSNAQYQNEDASELIFNYI